MPYQPTSRHAFQTANLPQREAEVFTALKTRGPSIDYEIAAATQLPINVVTGARNHLVEKQLVVNTGRTKINPASGKRGIVWAVREGEMPQEEPRQSSLF